MTQLEIGTHRRYFCNSCKQGTNHELKFIHINDWPEMSNPYTDYQNIEFWEIVNYYIWICLGCEASQMEIATMDKSDANEEWTSQFYPKHRIDNLTPKRFNKLSKDLKNIYDEVVECYNNDLKILCTVGLRALLEGIGVEQGAWTKEDRDSLKKKIEKLKEILPDNIVDSLHSFRLMGNDAAHQLKPPSRHNIRLAIEVMEDLLNFLYDLEYKAGRLPK